jgi:hypothetical protein
MTDPTYKANQVSAPTTETLRAIATEALRRSITIRVTLTGLLFEYHRDGRGITKLVSWLTLTCANDPEGICSIEMDSMIEAVHKDKKRTCARCNAVLADGPQPAATYAERK